MKVLVLHISDFHFLKSDSNFSARITSLVGSINNQTDNIEAMIIAATGDIAQSGDAAEYDVAYRFFDELLSKSKNNFKNIPVKLVVIPGNHDCVLQKDDEIRKTIIEKVLASTSTINSQFKNNLVSAQSNFFEFLDKVQTLDGVTYNAKDKLFWTQSLSFKNKKIDIFCFNTAWMSQYHEQQADIIYPLAGNLPTETSSSNLNISVLHHPFNWVRAENAKGFQKEVESFSDVILTGHEHVTNSYTKTSLEFSQKIFFEGGVYQDRQDEKNSHFGVLIADLEKSQMKHLHYSFENDHYVCKKQGDWMPFQRSSEVTKNRFELAVNFLNKLESAGATFTHPRKRDVLLNDIFVYPDLQDQDTEYDEKNSDIVDATILLDLCHTSHSALVLAPEQAGKSGLAKKIFLDLHDSDKVPLMLSGSGIKKQHVDWDSLLKFVRGEFEEQYQNTDWDLYNQQDKSHKVLIIDDFDHCSLNPTGKGKVIEHLEKMFSSILVFADDIFQIEEFTGGDSSANIFREYKKYRVLELGHSKRDDLIVKWILLGQNYTIQETEIEKRRAKIDSVLRQALFKRFLPSYPIFILICLQQIDLDQVDDNAGSYGYLFDSLIKSSISKATTSTFDTDTLMTYLSELASELLNSDAHEISFTKFQDFHEKYKREYGITITIDRVVDRLIAAGIILNQNDNIKFKYKYFYFYFVARHFSRSLKSPETIDIIKGMIKEIHREDNSNVLMFISFFDPESHVSDLILDEARSMFSARKPCDIKKVSQTFNTLDVSELGNYLEMPEDTRKARREALKKQELEHRRGNSAEDALDKVHDINRAAKLIQVLGQIIRNYPGSLKREPKKVIVSECYALGMRSLDYLYEIINVHQRQFLDSLIIGLNIDKKAKTKDEIEKLARRVFFFFNQSIARLFIHRVSRSVGTEKLEVIYSDVKEAEKNTSTDLIDLSIKLEHFGKFPEKELSALVKEHENNHFVTGILAMLVRHYMFLYPSDYAIKQKLSSMFSFKMGDIRNNEIKNQDRKLIPSKTK